MIDIECEITLSVDLETEKVFIVKNATLIDITSALSNVDKEVAIAVALAKKAKEDLNNLWRDE